MANLPETPQWEEGVYQIEVSDPVLGGPDGISNRPAKQLASRTSYLKQQVEKGGSDLAKHIAAADPHTQYAPKASPTFTGTPTAPTPAANDNSKKLVTTEFVARAIAALAGTAPETLDTLKELADALGNDPNFATTVLNKLAEKLAKDQNGADIPDPALFVKNLRLGDSTGYIGRLLNIRKITTSGTYTPTAGTKVCYAELQAGGGGGGSAGTCASGQSAGGGGGSAGAYALIKFAPVTMPVVIGSGSNGATANAVGASASDAGNTSIAGVTVYGGGGGWGGPPRASFPQGNNSSGRPGSASNTGTATIIKEISGQSGQGGIAYGATNSYGGGGGNSALGTGAGGGITTTGNGVGASGAGYGSGGSGSAVASGASSVAGGNGAPGVVIIWEYA